MVETILSVLGPSLFVGLLFILSKGPHRSEKFDKAADRVIKSPAKSTSKAQVEGGDVAAQEVRRILSLADEKRGYARTIRSAIEGNTRTTFVFQTFTYGYAKKLPMAINKELLVWLEQRAVAFDHEADELESTLTVTNQDMR